MKRVALKKIISAICLVFMLVNVICLPAFAEDERVWSSSKTPVSNYAYSFAVVGDTQVITRDEAVTGHGTYSPSYKGNMAKIYDWIVANKDSKNIQFSFHMGDVTDWSNPAEWKLAMENISKMDGKIPYNIARGNHDNGNDLVARYSTDKYASTVVKGEEYGFFDGRGIDGYTENTLNAYQTITVGNYKYLMLSLDLGPCKAVIEWANEVIAAHPYHNVIISTHSYLQGDYTGTWEGMENHPYMDAPKDCSATQYNPGGRYNNGTGSDAYKENGVPVKWDFRLDSHKNAGEDYLYQDATYMLNNLVKKHENICMVLCGHECSDYIRQFETTGDNGNTVLQFLVDGQGVDRDLQGAGQGHAGLIAMFYFSEDGSSVTTEYYSAVRNQYLNDSQNTKSYQLDLIECPENIAALYDEMAVANALVKNDYTVADWDDIQTALKAAREAVCTEDTSVINGALSTLKSVIGSKTKLDRTALGAAIEKAETYSGKKSEYDDGAWKTFSAALKNAKRSFDTSRDQKIIDSATASLNAAIDGLTAAPPKESDTSTVGAVDAPENVDAGKKKKGCGSSVAAGGIILGTVLALGAGVTFKKKEY